MKIYYPKILLFKNHRKELFPLLKPFIKNKSFSDDDRQKLYGITELDYTFVNEKKDADIIILPMSWNYYKNHKLYDNAISFVKKYSNFKILSWTSGDYGVKIHNLKNLFVIRSSGYKTKLSKNHIGKPVFFHDPLKIYFSTSLFLPIRYGKTPIVGFCGQENHSIINLFKECFRVVFRNILSYLNLSNNSPQALYSSSFIRASILKKIEDSIFIEDNFIKRKKYRAGLKNQNIDKAKTTIEFFENIRNSHYVICFRGNGNFSVRLYETIAMGRIPVFINSDCLLPYYKDWKNHAIWIERKNLKNLEESILEFHRNFDEHSFNEYLINNRKFWLEKMRMKSYFQNILNELV
jgi:hypothetical protein